MSSSFHLLEAVCWDFISSPDFRRWWAHLLSTLRCPCIAAFWARYPIYFLLLLQTFIDLWRNAYGGHGLGWVFLNLPSFRFLYRRAVVSMHRFWRFGCLLKAFSGMPAAYQSGGIRTVVLVLDPHRRLGPCFESWLIHVGDANIFVSLNQLVNWTNWLIT